MPSAPTEGRREPESTRSLNLPPILGEFCRNVLLLSAITVLYCLVMKFVFHRGHPYDWPFFLPQVRFSDFTIYQNKFHLFHQAAFFTTDFPFTYPAPAALMFELFFGLAGVHALVCFLLYFVAAYTVPAILFGRALVARGLSQPSAWSLTAVTLFLSWPILLMFDRGNTEVFVWVPLCIAAWAYVRGKEWLAAILFGVAASVKIFPIIYLALFFTRSKFPKMLAGLVACASVTVASLAVLGPTIAIANRGISTAMQFWQSVYMASFLPEETGLDHTLLAAEKVIAVAVFHASNGPTLQRLGHIYLPCMAILGTLLYFLRIRKLPRLNQLMAISILSIYITPFSGDGTLIHLYYGFAVCCFLAMDGARRRVDVPGLRAAFLCFAYLFATTGFVVLARHRFEAQVKCIVLGLLLYVVLRYPLGKPFSESASSGELAFPRADQIATAT